MAEQAKFESWAVVEIMGRLRTAGRCSEQVIAGTALLRVDVPDVADPEKFTTEFFGGGAIYRLTPCDEQIARAAAAASSQRPISVYEMADYERKQAEVRQPSLKFQNTDDEDDQPY